MARPLQYITQEVKVKRQLSTADTTSFAIIMVKYYEGKAAEEEALITEHQQMKTDYKKDPLILYGANVYPQAHVYHIVSPRRQLRSKTAGSTSAA